MRKLLGWVGATVGGGVGWWAGARVGLMTAAVASTVATDVVPIMSISLAGVIHLRYPVRRA